VKEEALAQWGLLRHKQTNKKLENFIIYDFVAYPEFCPVNAGKGGIA